jgi:hypothetical protein
MTTLRDTIYPNNMDQASQKATQPNRQPFLLVSTNLTLFRATYLYLPWRPLHGKSHRLKKPNHLG